MAWWDIELAATSRVGIVALVLIVCGSTAGAATLAPPMLDINRQCDATTRHNVTAMSECVVAESEARAEILQKWNHVSDNSAEKCLKVGRKSRRFPYSTIAKCLAVEPVGLAQPPTPAPEVAGVKTTETQSSSSTFSSLKHFFTSGK